MITAFTSKRIAREGFLIGRNVQVQVVKIAKDEHGRGYVELRVAAPRSTRILRLSADGQVQCKNVRTQLPEAA